VTPSKRFGIVLIAAFLLVTGVFITLYAGSITSGETPAPEDPGSIGSASIPVEYDGITEPDTDLPADSANEPAIPITGTAYLTFDDGPSRTITPDVLDILAEEGIKATFFILPREDVDDIFKRIIDEGHEIGNHTYSHDYTALFKGSAGVFKEDVIKAGKFMSDRFGYTTSSFRFPGGSMTWTRDIRNPRITILKDLGYTYYDWDIDSGDALQTDAEADVITANVLDNTNGKKHVIILMHDYFSRTATLDALPMIIKGLREQGYDFDIIRNYP